MRNKYSVAIIAAVSVLTLSISSCRDNSDEILSYINEDGDMSNFVKANSCFAEQFKAIWTVLDSNYPIWDYEKEIDWDKVYEKYLPVFEEWDANYALDKRNRISSDSLRNIYREILLPLHDYHMSVTITNLHDGGIKGERIAITPAEERNKNREDYGFSRHPSVYDMVLKYGTEEYQWNSNKTCNYYLLKDNIVYLSLSGAWLEDLLDEGDDDIREAWNCWFNKIQQLHSDHTLKGVIIDLRHFTGGNSVNYKYLLGALQPSDSQYAGYCVSGKVRAKRGPGRFDYMQPRDFLVPVYTEEHASITEESIVVLSSCTTASLGEHVCLGAKQMKNARVVGMRTWGALNPLVSKSGEAEDTFGGSYASFSITLPAWAFFTTSGECLEGVGITPDIEVKFDEQLYDKYRRDSQLERALEYIRTGK